jgi:hypothetical protein
MAAAFSVSTRRSDGSAKRVHPTIICEHPVFCRINLAEARTIRPTVLAIGRVVLREQVHPTPSSVGPTLFAQEPSDLRI